MIVIPPLPFIKIKGTSLCQGTTIPLTKVCISTKTKKKLEYYFSTFILKSHLDLLSIKAVKVSLKNHTTFQHSIALHSESYGYKKNARATKSTGCICKSLVNFLQQFLTSSLVFSVAPITLSPNHSIWSVPQRQEIIESPISSFTSRLDYIYYSARAKHAQLHNYLLQNNNH